MIQDYGFKIMDAENRDISLILQFEFDF